MSGRRIDRGKNIPMYIQLADILRNQIERGLHKQGDVYPSEAQLEANYKVSRITVRQSLQILTEEGYIYRHPGKPTIVQRSRPIVSQGHRLGHLAEELGAMGCKVSSKVFNVGWTRLPEGVAETYPDFPKKVFCFHDLIFQDGTPIALAVNYLVDPDIPIEITADELQGRNFYDVLEEDFNLRVVNGEQTIGVHLSDVELARLLKIKKGEPILYTEIVAFSQSGKPVLFVTVSYIGRKFRFMQMISR